jgi:gamma-glutamyl hercynylcysteine S-oxide synthase
MGDPPVMGDPLGAWLQLTRRRTLELAASLADHQLLGPRLGIVNPPLWEFGHVAWFQERWALRHGNGREPLLPGADALYDSARVAHDTRWDLPLPTFDETTGYLREVARRVAAQVASGSAEPYFVRLAIHHEEMHFEAMCFTRQTLGYPPPDLSALEPEVAGGGDLPGDAAVPGGIWLAGAGPEAPFVFDNEKWAHPVELRPFRIARAPVTQARFAEFVDDGGYRRRDLWSEAGWRWREGAGAQHPVYWSRREGGWARRDFHRWVPLEPHRPVVNVCWFEAEAWCRWAGRRLPSEAEWEAAAGGQPGPSGALGPEKRAYPWGDAAATPEAAQADARALRAVDVGALPASDSAFGCRQMLGNVWEWTSSDFQPYPGFEPDAYREYSLPWFGTHKVLRGGSFATPRALLSVTFRNFYTPDRRDPWAGFRSCAA